MEVTGITFKKTINFINRLYFTVGYPPCQERNPPTFFKYLARNIWFIIAYAWIFSVAWAQFLFVGVRPLEANIWEYIVQEVTVGYCFIGLTKMMMLAKRRNALASLLQNYRAIWPSKVQSEAEKDVLESYMQYNTFFALWFSILSVIMGYFWNLVPLAEMAFVWITKGMEIRQLPFNIWLPFDIFGTAYPYVYGYLLYSAHVVVVYHIAFDSLFCISVSHLCMHYRLLQEDIKVAARVTENGEFVSEESEIYLRNCIEKQQSLAKFRDDLANIFTDVIFVNFFVSSINICSVGFLMATNPIYHAIKFFMLFICYLIELFLFCWFGQELIDNSMKVADSAFECKWYSSSQKFKKMITYIIHRSQNPQVLNALKFWEISLKTFTKILSASWSYFALLNTALGELPYMKHEGGI
ncbi:odorant receptor 4-like [Phlebotomus argentipes]|uniref:odorant receptor 4-like n=1 Tax=Phlebotomus argentipes TaxID=94469 RepID=UPI002892D27F|nr:odorant receptor 4-like [Phlebotomus argentipes]